MTRYLGIDPGTVRCGVAITDSAPSMAFPRPALARDEQLLEAIRSLVTEEGVGAIVVGRPVALSGAVTASTTSADDLFSALREAFDDLPVVQWDERLTTIEASRSLSGAGVRARDQRSHLDSAAAVIMLQNYVDGLHAG
jgi:putative Holliday junction resolvase